MSPSKGGLCWYLISNYNTLPTLTVSLSIFSITWNLLIIIIFSLLESKLHKSNRICLTYFLLNPSPQNSLTEHVHIDICWIKYLIPCWPVGKNHYIWVAILIKMISRPKSKTTPLYYLSPFKKNSLVHVCHVGIWYTYMAHLNSFLYPLPLFPIPPSPNPLPICKRSPLYFLHLSFILLFALENKNLIVNQYPSGDLTCFNICCEL